MCAWYTRGICLQRLEQCARAAWWEDRGARRVALVACRHLIQGVGQRGDGRLQHSRQRHDKGLEWRGQPEGATLPLTEYQGLARSDEAVAAVRVQGRPAAEGSERAQGLPQGEGEGGGEAAILCVKVRGPQQVVAMHTHTHTHTHTYTYTYTYTYAYTYAYPHTCSRW